MSDKLDIDVSKEYAEAIGLLRSLVSIKSYSREEKEAADFLEKHIVEMGYAVERVENNCIVRSKHFSDSKPTLLLNAHIDTVKPVSAWTYDPHVPTEEGDRIYGLGTNDDGASLVSLLYAFMILDRHEQPYNMIYAASAEEEVSGKNGMEKMRDHLPTISLAVVGEPTNMNVAVAEKGLMVVDCYAHGKAGHAARNEGDNAIYKAIKDIEWIMQTTLPRQTEMLGPVKMQATMIQAGTQHNVVPDVCSFVVDVRSNECYSNQEIYEIMQQNMQSELKARSFRLSSSRISVDNTIVKRAIALGSKPFGSPTLSDQALMPFLSMKIGPGDSSRSHTANEFIVKGEIEEAIRRYVAMLDGAEIE